MLSSLKRLDVLPDQGLINVGPGNTWFDVYTALDPYGQYVIGGRLKTIGVPGLTLIGGVSYFNNRYGYSMDNVVQYDVVLGNGTQVVANNISNAELFWALKGGANNFGVVTNFLFQTHSIPEISTTIQVFDESKVPAFIEAVCNFVENVGEDASIGAGAVITVSYNTSTQSITASILGVQEGSVSPPSKFANFTAIPNATVRVDNVTTNAQWASDKDTPHQMFR